ncbi:uncharacterized protein LOC116774649 [Danaus plexippus]|uniref:Uncharacterized protein n=1 Tax=Danaus plexippus plexippus TaxID=278856 RepID=A0A212FA46_DANPL|nr:uncharacterized protein LOC116774649 [Danaus plexippus]OWR50600.1 hypothetical protein KGM_215535 [Danaus plexippus plexippus]
MAEDRIGLLFKAATLASSIQDSKTQQILKSYYMLKCQETTGGFGLPKKYFSRDTRCPRCGIEWDRDTETKLTTIRLTKKQRRRIRSKKKIVNARNKEYLFHSNKLEQICSFCGHNMKTYITKPEKSKIKLPEVETPVEVEATTNIMKGTKKISKTQHQANVYCQSKNAFNLKRNENNLATTMKPQPKVIKNNKKKKDKYAGLCKMAVAAAAKQKLNKLELFLKSAP